MTTQAMAKPVGAFFETEPEIRNKIYEHLSRDSRIWLSGSASPNTSEFPWKFAATCRLLYTEFTLFLAAATTLWLYEPGHACLNVTESVSCLYLAHIKTVYIIGNTTLFIDFKKMPLVKSVQFIFGAMEWAATTEEVVKSAFDGIEKNNGLLAFSRRLARRRLAFSTAFLDSVAIPKHVELVVSVVITARLPSKVDVWGEATGPLDRSSDHYDAIFEVHYNWRTGKILGAVNELTKAKEHLLSLFSLEDEHQVMVERLLNRENETEDQIEEMEWRTREWDDRQGEMFVAEGREWVFRGVVREVPGEVGPGHL